MVDQRDKDIDLELWNFVKQSTKKIISQKTAIKKNTVSNDIKKNIITQQSVKVNSDNKTKKHILTDKKPIDFTIENNSSGLNKRNIRELKTGTFQIETRLDLHGYRVNEAEKVFFRFILRCFNSNIRNILVITGKGNHGKGKIKKSLPTWLNDPRVSSFVYVYSFASSKDGGDGAFYIRLRNIKTLK